MQLMSPQGSDLSFGEFTLHPSLRELRRGDSVLQLTGKCFDLLAYMAANAGRPLLKAELLTAVWPDTIVEEANLSQNVSVLRKVLGTGNESPIRTLPGRGYQFIAQVSELPSAFGAAHAEPPPAFTSLKASHTRIVVEEETEERHGSAGVLRRLALAGLIVILLAGGGWFGWRQWQAWQDRAGGPPLEIVLAPMEGTTGDPVLDGALTAALRMDLSQSPFVAAVSEARVRATLTEMARKPEVPMALSVAREVCERTNSQAVLHGGIARTGTHFLLTEEATSCVDGAVLAEVSQRASVTEDLPGAVDKLAESLRRKLGESRRSVARFDVPLFSGNTASLEALKDFSQATVQANGGKFVDAIALLNKAVAADPGFAEAYYDLAAYYRTTLDLSAERGAILKAYSLRDFASEPVRLAIIALYHSSATQDLYEAERNYRNWTELYPRSAQAWNGLSVVQRDLGHHADALVAAQRALELRPGALGVYTNLAVEQRETGDLNGSLATCERAFARGLDGDYLRNDYFTTAYALGNAELVQKQRHWAAEHPEAFFIHIEEVEIAISEGRFADAHRLIPQIDAGLRHGGMAGAADDFIRAEAINLMEAGDVVEGSRLFRTVPGDATDEISVLGMARIGDFAAALSSLSAMRTRFPQGTLWNDYGGPEVQAIIALATHQPKDAIAALERSRPLEGRTPFLRMLRADAFLADGKPALAETSYRQVVDGFLHHADVEELPLSWLGLARAYVAEGNRPAAVDAYGHFFTLWAHADPDALYLRQARQEFAALTSPAV